MSKELFTADEAKEVVDYLLGEGGYGKWGELTGETSYKLYVILQPEMPYGIAKARTGTPEEWYPDYFSHYTEDGIREWVADHTQE